VDPRTKAIDDVREIFSRAPEGPPPRTCPSCGAEHATLSPFCPSCDKRYDRRFARVSDRQRWALGGLALVVVIVAAVLILPGVFAAKRDNDARVAREHAALVAAVKKRMTHEQRPMRGRPAGLHAPRAGAAPAEQLAARRRLVVAMEGAILTDAKARIASGELDGPVKRVSCGPLVKNTGNHTEDEDLSKTKGRYDCVAVKREVMQHDKVVGFLGHPFIGTADFKHFTYVWCKDNKVPSENGRPLVKVPIPAVCIGAEGQPRVGDGYLSESP
jgi:hypothetical protein